MATNEEVQKLASLSRLEIGEDATASFAKEFESILAYVSALESLTLDEVTLGSVDMEQNVFREDAAPHEGGLHTEKLVGAFPVKEGNLLKVKQILSHD